MLTKLGVHLGHDPNMAVLFCDDRVRQFLERHGIQKAAEAAVIPRVV
jgi:hypothetical protein